MDDRTIIDALAADEERGYGMLIERYTAYVAAVVGGVGGGRFSAGDVEELAADVFFRVWQRRGELRAETLKGYIARIARNASIDRLRGMGGELLPYEDDVLQIAHHELTDELAIVRVQKEIVERAVNKMGEPDREIFIRFYYFGEKVGAIADKLAINAATAKTKLRRARLRLRAALEERGYACE